MLSNLGFRVSEDNRDNRDSKLLIDSLENFVFAKSRNRFFFLPSHCCRVKWIDFFGPFNYIRGFAVGEKATHLQGWKYTS